MALPERRAADAEPAWLTVSQAARYLGVAQSTLRTWADAARVPSVKTVGGHRRFRRDDLDMFLASSRPRGDDDTVGPLVLIVDDDAGHREQVRASLEPAGYTVREAASAAEGIEVLEQRLPDLILFVGAPTSTQALVDSTKQLLPI